MEHDQLRVREILQSGEYTIVELDGILQALHRVDSATGDAPFAWTYLKDIAPEQFVELRQQPNSIVDGVLAKAVNFGDWRSDPSKCRELMVAAEAATEDRYGGMDKWRDKGSVVPTNADYIQTLAGHSSFPVRYADIKIEGTRHATNEKQLVALRAAESVILREMLGLPDALARNFKLSISERTMRANDSGRIIPLNQGGGIHPAIWRNVISNINHKVALLGADTLSRVYKACGIVDFDNLSESTIEMMNDLVQGKEDIIKRLKAQDLQVCIKDNLGDYNNALVDLESTLVREEGDVLFFGVRRPSDLYRPFALLAKHGIKPCTVFLALHGGIGRMGVGPRDSTRSYIQARRQDSTTLSIADSSVGSLFRERMQPSKQTGKREVVLIACWQANPGQDAEVTTTAEALAGQADSADEVVVVAGAEKLSLRRGKRRRLEFYDPFLDEQRVKTVAFQRYPERHDNTKRRSASRVGRKTVAYATRTQ
jgi:hypothetical protein